MLRCAQPFWDHSGLFRAIKGPLRIILDQVCPTFWRPRAIFLFSNQSRSTMNCIYCTYCTVLTVMYLLYLLYCTFFTVLYLLKLLYYYCYCYCTILFYNCFYRLSLKKKVDTRRLFHIPSCSMEIKQEFGRYNDMNLEWKFWDHWTFSCSTAEFVMLRWKIQ